MDGYNVIHAWPSLKKLLSTASLEAARDELIQRVSVLSMITGESVTVVFDAHHSTSRANSSEMVEGVQVTFTRKGHSADHAIERLAYDASKSRDIITVATSDRFQRDLVHPEPIIDDRDEFAARDVGQRVGCRVRRRQSTEQGDPSSRRPAGGPRLPHGDGVEPVDE